MNETLKAPFVWFGGKRKVAAQVWAALGDVQNFAEPFAGSLAVLLGRPHEPQTETVNDMDCFLSNFWRAISHDPEQVAAHCDWPVNECDLLARHLWLVNTGKERIAKMESDPDFYDAKVAGFWCWGINQWIGSGWCSGEGPWMKNGDSVSQRPHLGDAGRGVNRKLPHLGDAGKGVNRQLPHLGNAGKGVNRQLPHLGDSGQGVNRQLPHRGADKPSRQCDNDAILEYFSKLAARLRRVRVCCGDWSRIVTDGALSFGNTVGIFLDPPYLGDVRAADLYRVDDYHISAEVRDWAIANGDNPRYRIVLAGYWEEHADAMPKTWRSFRYSANVCYQNADSDGENKTNRHNETLWYSSHCVNQRQGVLFQ